MRDNIAAIIVTFNREIQLIECIKGILKQSLLPNVLYIIDNHSNPKTYEALLSHGFINQMPLQNAPQDQKFKHQIPLNNRLNELPIVYIRKAKNEGGAGGFYEGMKNAFDEGCDWLWLMDDDGVPDPDQLQQLMNISKSHNIYFSNSLVTNIDNPSELAFELGTIKNVNEIGNVEVLKGVVAAFNGTLISRTIIQQIGLIKKEMFIWGDETEYVNRVRKNGFEIGTITSAVHYHPLMKGKKDNVFPFCDKIKLTIKPSHFSHFYYRNLGYNTKTYANDKAVISLLILYSIYFVRKGKFKDLRKFYKYFLAGTQNKF